jgi:hypothetical protein
VLDFSIDTSGTPQDVQRRQKLADALLQEGMSTSPAAGGQYGGWLTAANRALAGALGGYRSGQLANEERAGLNRSSQNFASGFANTPSPPTDTPAPLQLSGAQAKSGIAPNKGSTPDGWTGETAPNGDPVYTQDKLNPMDEPRGADRTKMIATLLGEEKPGSPESLGAANVIRNRAVDGSYGGNTPDAVVQSPNQFSPWNDQAGRSRMSRALQNPGDVAKANDTIDQTYGVGKYASAGPNDPTEGKTYFYDPASMVPPNSVPKWAQGKQGQQIGKTLFFDDPNDPSPNAVQVASNDPGAVPGNAAPTQGYAVPGQAQGQRVAQNGPANVNILNWANSVINDPYANASQKQVAAAVMQRGLTPKDSFRQETDADGNVWSINNQTGQRTVAKAAEKDPASVQEYEYYKKNLPAGTGAMDYSSWSDKKSRAAATSVTTNVDTKGPDKYDSVMAEGMAKAHGALANGVEDAQARARDLAAMQGAVDAIQKNGGTTGGLGQAQVLDLQKTINAGAGALGLDAPVSEKGISDKEFLQKFNRQIAGQQAKGAVGSRVTNFEMSNYLKANPGIEMSLTGNQRLIGIQSQIEQRNVAVGNAIREATAQAVGDGQKINPMTVQKIIKDYDEQHHVKDPVTGQDLTQSYTLPEFQKPEQGSNAGLAAGHETNMKKMRVWDPVTGKVQ